MIRKGDVTQAYDHATRQRIQPIRMDRMIFGYTPKNKLNFGALVRIILGNTLENYVYMFRRLGTNINSMVTKCITFWLIHQGKRVILTKNPTPPHIFGDMFTL